MLGDPSQDGSGRGRSRAPLALVVPRWTTQPPAWMRVSWLVLPFMVGGDLAARRGIAVGIFAGIVYLALGLACALSMRRVLQWSRAHPVLDSAIIIPLSSWPWR